MRSRCQKFVELMSNFAAVDPAGAHACLFVAMTKQSPVSRRWRLIVDAMRKIERRGVECSGR